jgi:hypothetical protein
MADEPVWAWMEQDRWWPAVILARAADSSCEGDYVTVRLVHGVSVTVPTKYIVCRDPSLNGKDKPNFSSVLRELLNTQRAPALRP